MVILTDVTQMEFWAAQEFEYLPYLTEVLWVNEAWPWDYALFHTSLDVLLLFEYVWEVGEVPATKPDDLNH